MRMFKPVSGLFCSALCSAATAACGSGDGRSASSDSVVATTREAVQTAPAAVDYLHVKGVQLMPGSAGSPPSDATCQAATPPTHCYSPQQIQTGYGVSSLLKDGINGKGETILIFDAFGTPTIAADLHQFDADYGLPDPPSFQVLAPNGTVPYDPTNGDMQGWAFETTLDVEWAHALAPGANIILLTSTVSETEGTTGMPEMLALEKYALDHHLGHIISQSWGATENTLFDAAGRKVFADFEAFYARARREHVTVFASAGDGGSSNQNADGGAYTMPTIIYPASSPNVTAVGGTSLTLDVHGNYQSEIVWDSANSGGGGGVSQYFAEPAWQRGLPKSDQTILAGHRGIPDVAYNADPRTGIMVYVSIPGITAGYYTIGGTSEGAPQWAGIAADLNQLAGRPLGYLNSKLYVLGELGATKPFFHDVTVGNNGAGGVAGYSATVGWDLATGWGTPSLDVLGKALAGMQDDD